MRTLRVDDACDGVFGPPPTHRRRQASAADLPHKGGGGKNDPVHREGGIPLSPPPRWGRSCGGLPTHGWGVQARTTRGFHFPAGYIALVVTMLLAAAPAQARVGFGDPAESFRNHKSGELLDFKGHLRVRGAAYNNLDLDRGNSPSTGLPLWPKGEGPLDTTTGADMRLRLSPSLWLNDDVRMFLEVDLLDNLTLGSTPRGTPYNGRTGIVAGTAFQDPATTAAGAFRIRTAMGEAITPLGVVSAGRMPSHFGLGIAANAGDDLDDDGGDRADRVAWVLPFVGHFLAAAADLSSSGPRGNTNVIGPNPLSPALTQQAISLAMVRYRAPWEVNMHRRAKDLWRAWVLDYGAAVSTQFQVSDSPVFYQALSGVGLERNQRTRRNYVAAVADGWVRLWWKDFRFEAEGVVSQLYIGNGSPYPGVEFRKPILGNPVGGVMVAEWTPLKGLYGILGEVGFASPDPSPGFPQSDATAFVGSQPGDAFGPQIDGVKDRRMDAFRIHPMYRVDLILWRTLLGGVSEAAYVRSRFAMQPVEGIRLELNGVYSHALSSVSAPGGMAPLGAEVDSSISMKMGAFMLRADGGVLLPLGGMGARGGRQGGVAEMVLLRVAYAR
jgi:uncharacterized protein (TIGR04551 family)